MASNLSRPEGVRRFDSTTPDVEDISAGILDKVNVSDGYVIFRGIKAGPGIEINLVDSDGYSSTFGRTVEISTVGSSGGGEANTLGNVGNGISLIGNTPKIGSVLQLKTLQAGMGVEIDTIGDIINISATSSSGNDGSIWFVDSGIPSSILGKNNDLYLDSDTGNVYQKNNNIWGIVANIIGPKGDTGVVTVSNTGSGTSVISNYDSEIGELNFKTFAAGSNVTITEVNGSIVISSSGGSSGGSSNFLELSDTPTTYSGSISKYLKVNLNENGLIFDSITTSDIVGLSNVASTGNYQDLINLPNIPQNLNDINDINITSPSSGQVLSFDGTRWINSTPLSAPVTSVNAKTGNIVLTSTDIAEGTNLYFTNSRFNTQFSTRSINELVDVDTSGAVIGSILKYNGSSWIISSESGGTGSNYLYELDDVSLSTSSMGQFLRFDGNKWINQTYIPPVTSVSGKTGAISLTINDISNISINSPNNGQALIYNGTNWVNSSVTPSFNNQNANNIFAGPITGNPNSPSFRALVPADIPSLDASKISTGTLILSRGGTGSDLSQLLQNQLIFKSASGLTGVEAPGVAGTFLSWNGSSFVWGVPSSSGVEVQQLGSTVVPNTSTINFIGDGVSVSNIGGVATVNIPNSSTGNANGLQVYKFQVQFDGTNPNSTNPIITETIPSGWNITLTNTDDLEISHNTGLLPVYATYLGLFSGSTYRSRAAYTPASDILVDPNNPSTFIIENVTSTNTGALSGSNAWVFVYFI